MADLRDSYLNKAKKDRADQDIQFMDSMVSGAEFDTDAVTGKQSATDALIFGPGQRTKAGDSLGRPAAPKTSTAGKAAANVGEFFTEIPAGMHDAVMAAVDPLADWLNKNVYDLEQYGTYKLDDPKTTTGRITKGVSQFLTGFIPAVKGMKAMGITGAITNPMAAGMVADFATRDGHDGRLTDMLVELGVPEQYTIDWLKTDKDSPEFVERFKTAVEGAGLGLAADGLFAAARYTKYLTQSGKKLAGADAEVKFLKERYGELTDDEIKHVVGDPSQPVIEVKKVHQPQAGKKVVKAEGELPNLDPRSVIRVQKNTKTKAETYEVPEALKGTALVDKQGKPVTVYHATHRDFGEISTTKGAAGTGDAFIDIFNRLGAHFTDDPKVLSEDFLPMQSDFIESSAAYWDEAGKHGQYAPGANIRPTYLNIKKPFDIGSEENLMAPLRPGGSTKSTAVEMTKDMADNPDIYEGFIKIMKEYDGNPDASAKAIKELLAKKGYDGLSYVGEIADIPGARSYIAFDDKQIVSAFDQRVAVKMKAPTVKQGVKSEDFEVYVNFDKISEPDQVKFTIGKMAEAMKGSIDEAARGKITFEQTERMANDLGLTVTQLLERRKGQPFNAEEALAARELLNASATNLLNLAKAANGKAASDLDLFKFRRAMALHGAIQNEVLGARTETARALNAWKIPAKGGIESARAIDQIMKTMGGPEHTKELAQRLAILAEFSGDPAVINRFIERGWGSATMDAVKEVWVNGLLWSPKTHVVNTMSNSLVVFQSIYERGAAAQLSKLIGHDGVESGEATAMAFGVVQSWKDAFRMAAKSFRTGQTGYAFNKIDVTHPNAMSADAFNIARESGTGKFVDFLGHAATVPGRLLGAEDEFFKTINYRAELNAQALRQAKQEGLSGQMLKERVADLILNPPEHLRINSADAAMYNTFTSELGKFGTAIMNLRNVDSPLNPLVFVLPFVRTPANIARYTFERTPFAPLVGQWRADIAAGGARADLALAKMATGTAIMGVALDMASSGLITGQGPTGKDHTVREALTRSGWQPYSFKAGDRWVSYNRTDPFGMALGFAASINEAITKGELDEEDVDEWQEVMAMSIAAVSQVTINKTYLEGFSNFVEVMSDPTRYSESYVNNLVSSFLPMTSLMGSVEGIADPTQREAYNPSEAIQAKIAGLSDQLPPRRDLWGQPITNESGLGRLYDAVTPLQSKPEDVDPVDFEIVRLGKGPSKIPKKGLFDGVRISFKKWPEVYDEYVRLAGNDLKHPAWGMGAKDYLNAVIEGKHPISSAYKMMSDEARRDFIVSTVSDFRRLAQYQIMNDPKFADFAAAINGMKQAQQQSKMPVFEEQ